MDCQAGLPGGVVARHKGIAQKKLVVFVEKSGELVWKIIRFSKKMRAGISRPKLQKRHGIRATIALWLIYGNLRLPLGRLGCRCVIKSRER